jgi:hypothetical protein
MTDKHKGLLRVFAEQPFYICGPKARGEKSLLFYSDTEVFRADIGGLRRARERARYDQVWVRLESDKQVTNLMEFAAASLGQRTFIVRSVPIWPIGGAMTKKIESHKCRMR